MTAPRIARRLYAEPAPVEVPLPRRGRLEAVPDPRIVRRRRVTRLFTALAGLTVCFGLFGVVVLHVMLAQGQGDVQHLQAQVQEEEAQQERLRLEVAGLESPASVVAAARQRLGMIAPTTVTPLAPASLDDPPPTTIAAPRPPAPSTTVPAVPSDAVPSNAVPSNSAGVPLAASSGRP